MFTGLRPCSAAAKSFNETREVFFNKTFNAVAQPSTSVREKRNARNKAEIE